MTKEGLAYAKVLSEKIDLAELILSCLNRSDFISYMMFEGQGIGQEYHLKVEDTGFLHGWTELNIEYFEKCLESLKSEFASL